jgi:hypothetical protein
MSLAEAQRLVADQVERRSETFLRVLERGVFARPQSPYRRLCEHAGIGLDEIADWVRREGVETTLERLYDRGVHVTFEEFKGRAPIERRGLAFAVRPEDFDNPLLAHAYTGQTGGSRGAGTRVAIDLDLLNHDAAANLAVDEALGLAGVPRAQWRPVPPASAAMSDALRCARTRTVMQQWFSQARMEWRRDTLAYDLFATFVLAASRLAGNPLPRPEYTPLERIDRVAEWMADRVRSGTTPLMSCPSSSAVRICHYAREHGIDLAGSIFRVGGDPLTPGKAAVVGRAGARFLTRYSLNELGNIGLPCAAAAAPDGVHLLIGKIGVIQRPRDVGCGEVMALVVTTLLPASPKLMLNVDIGDHGVLEESECGCPTARFGLPRPFHTIRSHEKLTSEGMTFSGEDVLRLVDDLLPEKFGGSPADFQLVEREASGLPRISVVVSPRLGEIDERALVATVLDSLGGRRAAWRMAAARWRDAETLQVERREPYLTSAAKILPLHVRPAE